MKPIFVFGSNLAGRHGAGAALFAIKYHGAIYRQGVGLQGNSYAIPTKDENIRTLPLRRIDAHVSEFRYFAATHPDMVFNVTAIGCGLAGYKPEDIAPMFKDSPPNCILPAEFLDVLDSKKSPCPECLGSGTVQVPMNNHYGYTTNECRNCRKGLRV